MRRAILLLVVAVAIGLAFSPPPAFTAAVGPLNGIGLIDYSQKPTFKIGDWAKYRMSGKSELGMKDNYVVTVLIAGEQDFWGDPAFWIETWTDAPGLAPQTEAALMSYDIFGDTSAVQSPLWHKLTTRVAPSLAAACVNTAVELPSPRPSSRIRSGAKPSAML